MWYKGYPWKYQCSKEQVRTSPALWTFLCQEFKPKDPSHVTPFFSHLTSAALPLFEHWQIFAAQVLNTPVRTGKSPPCHQKTLLPRFLVPKAYPADSPSHLNTHLHHLPPIFTSGANCCSGANNTSQSSQNRYRPHLSEEQRSPDELKPTSVVRTPTPNSDRNSLLDQRSCQPAEIQTTKTKKTKNKTNQGTKNKDKLRNLDS